MAEGDTHQSLFENLKEKIEFAFADAVERGVEDPVVFVLDLRGDGGSWIADRFAERPKIDDMIAESARRGTAPTLTVAVSRKQASLLVGELNPSKKSTIETAQIPDTHFLAIAVSDTRISGQGMKKP